MDPAAISTLIGLAGAPIVAALVSALIKPFVADSRYYPAGALALGLAWNLAVAAVMGASLGLAGLMGVLSGLAAAGLYSGGKAVLSGTSP